MLKLINVHEMLVEIPEKIHDKYTYLGNRLESDDIGELLLKEQSFDVNVLKCKYINTNYVENILTYKIKYILKD